MDMALWSSIIRLPFLIMYISLCTIDCGYWMLSLNQFFLEEKWFVYEQSLPLPSMTAPAAVKAWNRRQLECTEQDVYFLLASILLLGTHVCLQIDTHGTNTWTWHFLSLLHFKDESSFRVIVSLNIKSTEVELFMFAKQQRITLKCLGVMMAGGDEGVWWRILFLWAWYFPPAVSPWPKWLCFMLRMISECYAGDCWPPVMDKHF